MKRVNNSLHMWLCPQRWHPLQNGVGRPGRDVDKWCHARRCRGPARPSPRHRSDSAHCSSRGPVDSVLQQGGTICNCSPPPPAPGGEKMLFFPPPPPPRGEDAVGYSLYHRQNACGGDARRSTRALLKPRFCQVPRCPPLRFSLAVGEGGLQPPLRCWLVVCAWVCVCVSVCLFCFLFRFLLTGRPAVDRVVTEEQ